MFSTMIACGVLLAVGIVAVGLGAIFGWDV